MRPDRLIHRVPTVWRRFIAALGLASTLLAAAMLTPVAAAAAGPLTTPSSCSGTSPAITCDLWAETGTVAVPVGPPVTMWGYATASGASPGLPGPTIVLQAGDTLTLNLTNHLPQATSLAVQGLPGAPDLASVPTGGSHAYTIEASAPGTYLYEAGILPGTQYQVAMGLYGVLVVRPAGAPAQAYADASTAFNDEALLVLGEIDPALSNSATPASFDLRTFAPRYFLVNGKPYSTAGPPPIPVTAGTTALLRFANAGLQHHSMAALGLHQRVLSIDGSRLPAPRTVVAETLAPGQTADVLVSLPATTAADTLYAVYDAALNLNNSSTNGMGGMLAFLDAAAAGSSGDTVGPITTGISFSFATGDLAATASDASTGNGNVIAAEYFIDASGADGSGMAMTGTFGTPTVALSATVPASTLAALSTGAHTIYIHGQDDAANWGAIASVTFVVDRAGPTVSGITVNPSTAGGSVAVSLGATASDAASGNANVAAAEYAIDGGPASAMALNTASPTVSLTATIPAATVGALAEGSHSIGIRAQDSLGNWGAVATGAFKVDKTGPGTSGLSANPPANNGSYPQSATLASVRLSATVADPLSAGVQSNVAAVEGFIDTLGANGTGFPLTAVDGALNATSEAVYADIPLSTVGLLAIGNHTLYVRGRDAAGNWGTPTSLVYLIDRQAPTLGGVSLTPVDATLGGGFTITLTSPADPTVAGLASGVAGGEYWIDQPAPTPGAATPFTGTGPVSVPSGTLTTGSHTVGVRIRDAAGNWSSISSGSVSLTAVNIFASTFDTGFRPWGWSSASTTSTTRLNVSTPGLDGVGRKLQAQANNANFLQFNYGTASNPAWATLDARFRFNASGAAGTGQSIFQFATSSTFSTVLGHVRYRLNATQPQVQLQLGSTANASWVNLGAGVNTIEVVWQAAGSVGAAPGTLSLYLNGSPTAAQTLSTTTTSSAGAFRLGSVSAGSSTSLLLFDTFAAKRSTSSLYGNP